jgi:hypothetical protein
MEKINCEGKAENFVLFVQNKKKILQKAKSKFLQETQTNLELMSMTSRAIKEIEMMQNFHLK